MNETDTRATPEHPAPLEYRRASEEDLAAEYAVFVAAQEELHARRGAPWPVLGQRVLSVRVALITLTPSRGGRESWRVQGNGQGRLRLDVLLPIAGT